MICGRRSGGVWNRTCRLRSPGRGRPSEDHRRILNGILRVLRTGAPWPDLPGRYGPVGTVSSRFYRWRASGVWERVLSALQAEADARGEGEAQAREALGRSRGGFSTKLHLRAEGDGRPITAAPTGGERHEQVALEALLDRGAIRRPGGSGLACGRGARPATRATAARPPGAICGAGTSGR
jgi:transposase